MGARAWTYHLSKSRQDFLVTYFTPTAGQTLKGAEKPDGVIFRLAPAVRGEASDRAF